MRKRYKIAILALTAAVATTSVVSVVSCGKKSNPLDTDWAGKTVCYKLPTDGSTPDQHTGIENIGYMVYRLQNQPSYYSEMHGSVSTMIEQTVETYKQYNDGVMIASDISISSMVKTAQQTCFVGDYVLWRGAATGAADWDGLNTKWETNDPTKITVEDYKANYGLPGTDFSVYILNEDTVLSASDVTVNADGTYTQTFELNPETDAAPYYYRQKMLTTGGLDEWPVFSSIRVTYTFDSTWQILSSVIDESYSAKMIVSVGCNAHYVTTYEYETPKAESSDYEDYYSNYADKPVSELPSGGEITAAGCLTQAFGEVLTGPAVFNVSLTLNGTPVDGVVYVDINNMDIRAAFGNLRVWYAGEEVYLALGDLKAKVSVEEFASLLGEMMPEGSSDFSEAIDVNALLEQLGGGEFVVGETQATLNTTLSLFGMDLPVCFTFNLGESITLGSVKTALSFGDFDLSVSLTGGTDAPAALPEAEKGSFIELMPYVNTLVDLFTGDAICADLSYSDGDLSLSGEICVNLKEFAAAGSVSVVYGTVSKQIDFSFDGETVYLNLDGIKLRANAEEAVTLIGKYVDLPDMQGTADIDAVISAVLSLDTDSLVQMSETGNTLQIAIKGTELLKAFGVEFELGDVTLNVTESGLTASALGAEISVTAGEAFTADTEGYTDIVKYAGYLIDLFSNENLKAELSFANGDLALDGTVALNLKDLLVKGEFVLSYKGVQKDVKVIYGENVLYLELEGLKVKANIEEALGLVKEFVAIPETDGNAEELILKVLSLNFGEVIGISEDGTSLSVVLKGTELLKALGVEFELGDVALNVTESGLTASAYGATVAVTAGEAFTADTEGYADIVRYAGYLIDLFSNENLKADISFASGDLALDGTVALNLKDLLVKGEFVLSYKGVQKDVKIIYGENVLYLELEGLKVKANTEEALGLVKEFVAIPETDGSAEDILLKVLSLNFGEVIGISEDGTSLSVVLKGTELLKALGVEFELGDVALNVTESGLTASAYGATVAVTAGEAFTADTEGYADIVKYAGYLIDLFSNENLKAELSFANGDLALDGTVALNLKDLLVKGEFVVSYKGIEKDVKIVYGENVLYLELEGLKVKASVEEALGLVKEFVAIPETDGNAEDILLKVLSLNFGEVIAISEDGTALSVVLKGTEFLKALGVEFELGDVMLNVTESGLTASAYGAEISVMAGEAFTADTEGYTDIVKYAGYLIDLFSNENLKAELSFANGDLALDGTVALNLKDLLVKGEFVVSYKGIEKDVKVIYGENVLYLELEGLKVKANIEEALGLVKEFVAIPETDDNAEDILLKVLSLNFGEVISVSEDGTSLSVIVKGTELLKAFGVEFELGDVMLNVTESGLTASALGAEISVTAGEAFTADTEGYTDIVRYAGYLIDLFSNENLKADISFASGDLALSGNIDLNLNDLLVKGEFVVSYKGVQKDVKVIYGENVLYLELEGLKVKASVEEALGLVKEFVAIPETDGNAEELILKVLSLNFGEVISVSEDGTALSVVLKGTELLKALGVEFELGDVALNVTESGLTASALGAEISVTAGEEFTADTEGYTDIVRYAGYLIDLFSNENLKADISFANGDLALSGNIDLNLKNLLVKGEFVVSYKGIEKDVKVIYGENVLYLELEGLKVKASVEEALGLVKEFVAIPETDGNAEELILKVLSLNFGEVINISEDGTSLSVIVKGTELLKALGVEFELGDVALNVTESGLTASAYGAEISVTAGEAFTADTEGYTDIVRYAGYLIDLFSNENLNATVSYASGDLALNGTVALNLKDLLVKGEFVLSYKGVQKDVKVIYGENVLYLELEGLKVKANTEEALGLVKEFVAIPETDGNAEDILLKVLSLNFGEVIDISEDGTSLSVVLKGTELLKAFGVEFELGDVMLNVTESGLTASALGAEISVTAGEEFAADTEGYTDIVRYAGYLIDLFSNENLKADISFANGDLALDGTVALNLKDLLVKGEFVLSYKGVQKDVKVIYGENVLYLELEGLKVKASVEEALGLVKEFVAIPETDGNAEDILLKVLSLNFGEVIDISEDGTSLSVIVKGTELLKAFGVEFELGDVTLNVTESGLTASAYGATVAVTAGEAFTTDTEGYTDIVKYAGYLIDLFSNENLKADISFASGDLALDGTVALNLKDLLVKGEFVVSYKGIEKDVKVIYGENVLYLELEGLKVKASVEEALGLVKEFVSIPETDGNAEELILKVLSLNFGEVIDISEDGTSLSVVLKGTELLKAFGVEFELGDVALNVTESGLTASALGAEISVTAGEAFTADTEGYTDIVKYAGYLIDLFSNENLKADISFANGDLALDGTVALNLKDLLVKGEFVLSYKGVQKDVKVIYGENVLYLELEGLKVKASVEEALGLVKEFVSIPETDGNAEELLLKVLSLNFGEVINISEDGTSLSVLVKGTELLKAFGVEFELGDVTLNVTESGITASAYGANVAVTAGEAFAADTEGYADIVKYAGYLIDLFSNENLKADISFASGDLALDGTVALNLKDLLVKGEFVVSYKGIEKDVKVIYGENVLYLELEGLKVKANIEEALGLVKEFVAIPETDGNAEDILLKVLSLNFGEVIAISEDGTALSVVLKGTELLKALGVEFELGDVALNVTESGLTASAYGAEISVMAGEAFTADTEGYTDIVKYAGYLIDLFSNENLKAELSFANGDLALDGTVALNLKDLLVKGEFVVSYKGIEKDVKVIYGENVLYLELEGLKVKANIEEALGLVKEFVAIPETDDNAEDILLKVLSLNFGEVISVSEDGTSLSVIVKGTELLKAFGVEFELGDVMLNVTESGLTASALGAEISVTAGEAFTADTEGYTDIVRYAGYLIDLFSNENLKADIAFASGDISVNGAVALNLKDLLVKGEFVLSYKGVQKDVKVIYGENVLYLELEGLKVKANIEEALGLVKEFVAIPETDGNAEDILLKVLSLNFGEVISVSEDGTALSVVLKGTELLKALGVEFELGDVALNVTESGLTASALGAEISVTAGEAFAADTEGYVDAIGTIEAILSIVKQEGVSLGGAVDLTIGTTQVNLIFDKAAISWKDGFKLYAEMTVYVAGTQHDILLQTDGTSVQIAYGAVGATLSKEELPTLEEAIVTLYNRIKAVVDEAVVAAESPLPAVSGWEDLLALLGLGEQLGGIMDTADAPIGDTVAGLLGQIEFCAPTQPNGIFVIRMGALTAELLQNPADEKLVFQIDYAGEGFAVSAEVHAEALTGAFPAIPESVHLLTADDFAVLCDYVGAAAESLLLDEITVSLDGTVNSTAEEYAPFGGVKYALGAQIEYRSGGKFPVSLDLDGKKITVSPDVYAHISLSMVASLSGDESLYLDCYLLDANPDGSTDGILDLYLSVSRFAESAAKYAPLNLYLPADDLMTAVSAVLSMAGLDSGFLNETIVSEWLDVETTEQLRALGESLKGTLGLDELLGALGVSAMSETDAFVVSDLIRDFTVTDEAVSLTLESDTVYGASMPDDIFLSLTKGAVASADGATRGYLSSFRLDNVYTDATATEKLSLALALVPSCAAGGVSIGSYYNFTGVGQLLKTLAKSATHPAGDGYAVNDYFFLNGTVDLNALSLLKVTVNIEGIAVYLDEDFNVAVDMRISYPGVQELNQVLINGDSSVDLSIRGGMVYMKRVQTSEYYWNTLISMKEREIEPVTLYRVMPLDRFLDDILNQLVFLFNFGDLIADQIAGSGDPAPAESVAEDYGAMIASYLTSYSYAAGTSPAWTVVLNGASLTDDVMGDIGITLSTSADGILSGLTATTSVYSVMDITAQLTYRNPRGQMQEGVTDPTVNIGEYLEREMSKGLAQADWENTLYLEAAPKSANFIAVGELLNTQTVLCDTATNAIYTQLSYPDLSAYPELTGYRLGWKQADILPADGNIYANYVANVYTVTILSEREAEGMTFDGALGMWKAELPYTYGTKLELPAGLFADKAMQTVSYTDADGKAYSFVENILSDLTLTAHWDYIEYTMQFVADGEIVGTQTAHYGDAIEYPAIPEKTGYDVVGWNSSALTAEGDMTVEAVYAAKTFTVTLYSEFELDGFTACEGGYTLALAYTYGETLALPVGVEKEHHFLNVYEDAEGKTYTVVENILSDLTLTARWEELGYKVDFVADGVTVATHNYYEGDSLNPPAVPGKAGYVGSWDIPEGYTVSGDDTVYAVYTPATYTVTVYSDLAADGFAATGDGRHSYSFDYTYGSAAVVLDPSLKVPCYDFGGYTLADGTPVSQVENIVSDLAVYVVWVDNTVTVRLSSDAEFNGYEGYNAADGYYLTVKFNDVYDLTQSLTAVGYKQFGWWTEANGSWERVTSVAGLDGAAVWAAWIADDLNVTVTEASTSLGSWGGTWTIGGTYQGGKPYGDHSKEIFSSVGVSRSDGVYYRASKDGVSAGDTLSSGDLVGVSGGTFYKSGMTSAKGSLWKYGGADAHITYSYGDLSVTVDSATVFRKK